MISLMWLWVAPSAVSAVAASASAATCALASVAASLPRAPLTSFSNSFWLLSPASITSELIAIIIRRKSSVSTNDFKFYLQRREDRSCQDGGFGRRYLVLKWRGGFWKQRWRNSWIVRLNLICFQPLKWTVKIGLKGSRTIFKDFMGQSITQIQMIKRLNIVS